MENKDLAKENSEHNNEVRVQNNVFQASVVKVDITPRTPQRLRGYQERISTGVHDHIYHRIVVLHDGETPFVLVSTDAASLSPLQYERMASKLKSKAGIKRNNFWWSLTHTHSAPEIGPPGIVPVFMPNRFKKKLDTEYVDFVEKSLFDGVHEALKKLQPVSLGIGWGFSQANINRRAVGDDGKAFLGNNPDKPVDRRIGLLRMDKQEDGSPLVFVANYPIHGTVLGSANLEISADVAGVVSEYVEEKTGAPLLFINGAAGNQAPIYSGRPSPHKPHLRQFRVLLGDKILDAAGKISKTTNQVTLKTYSTFFETPKKRDLDWPDNFNDYLRVTEAGDQLLRIPLKFMKINEEMAVWSAPLELFCEVANTIRHRSPFPYTFYFGYTNGSFTYLPTREEWKHEGYEPRTSIFTPAAAQDLTETVLTYLHGYLRA